MRLRPRLISVLVGQGGEGEGNHPGMDILVVGDSLMRQLYSRLVHMLRGHRRVFDYKMHTHAAYSVCKVPLATAWRGFFGAIAAAPKASMHTRSCITLSASEPSSHVHASQIFFVSPYAHFVLFQKK